MDKDKRETGGGGNFGSQQKIENSVGEKNIAEALRKCLEENKGERTKCNSVVDAFKSSTTPKKPSRSFSLGRVSLTDV
jgi:hypothetical protein